MRWLHFSTVGSGRNRGTLHAQVEQRCEPCQHKQHQAVWPPGGRAAVVTITTDGTIADVDKQRPDQPKGDRQQAKRTGQSSHGWTVAPGIKNGTYAGDRPGPLGPGQSWLCRSSGGSGGGVVEQVRQQFGPAVLALGDGVVVLGLQGVAEHDRGLEEPAAFTDRLEGAVELLRSSAPAVAEHPADRLGREGVPQLVRVDVPETGVARDPAEDPRDAAHGERMAVAGATGCSGRCGACLAGCAASAE